MKLQTMIDQFIEYREALGEQYSPHCTARAFCRFVGPDTEVTCVSREQVNKFLTRSGITLTWHSKIGSLRTLYQYAVSRGYVTDVPLPTTLEKRPPPFVAYIYSQDELERLLQAAKSFGRPINLPPMTFHLMLLLTYATGMRVSEVLRLNRADVNITECLLNVHQSKFGKTRQVPFATSLQDVLSRYDQNRSGAPNPSSPFFATVPGDRIKADTFQHNFRALCDQLNIRRSDAAGCQPRIHDLRHSFAVHRLTTWYEQGLDVQKLLPFLSIYLGHVHIRATQVYLSMTPELLEQAGNRFETYMQGKDHRHV